MPGKRYRDHVCEQGFFVERVTRIELALSAWEADVLPLNYTRRPGRPRRIRADRPTAPAPTCYRIPSRQHAAFLAGS